MTPVGTVSSDAGKDLYIGNNSGLSGTIDGLMDEIRFFNRTLSAAEITALYKQFMP